MKKLFNKFSLRKADFFVCIKLFIIITFTPMTYAIVDQDKWPDDLGYDQIASIDLRKAVLETQRAKDALNILREDPDYIAKTKNGEMLKDQIQEIEFNIQNSAELYSQEEIIGMKESVNNKTKELEYLVGEIDRLRSKTMNDFFKELNDELIQITQKFIKENGIRLLLNKDSALYAESPRGIRDFTSYLTSMIDGKSLTDIKKEWNRKCLETWVDDLDRAGSMYRASEKAGAPDWELEILKREYFREKVIFDKIKDDCLIT